MKFTPLRKRNDVSWNGNPSEINEWLFNQFLEQHWSYMDFHPLFGRM